jgi:uncharacterized membrane protein
MSRRRAAEVVSDFRGNASDWRWADAGSSSVSRRIAFAGWAVYAAVMLWLAATLNIWTDEAYSLRTTSSTLSHAVVSAIGFEQNAPFYFVVLWVLRRVSASVMWARLFSLSCAGAALALAAATVRRCFPRLGAQLMLPALAMAPLFVWSALTIRMYALSILLVALFTWILVPLVAEERRPSAFELLALALVSIAGTYTAYSFGVLLAGFGCALFALRRWRALAATAVASAATAVAVLPLLAVLRRTVSAYAQAYVFHPSLASAVVWCASTVTLSLVGLNRLGVLSPTPAHSHGVIGIVAMAALCTALALNWRRLAPAAMVCALAVGVSSLILGLVMVVGRVEFFEDYLVFLMVPAYVTVAGLLSAVQPSIGARGVAVSCALALSVNALAFAGRYHHDANFGDWRRVAAYVQLHEHAGEPVLVFTNENELPLRYYYRGPNRLIPLPSQASDVVFDSHDFVLRDGRQIDAALEKAGVSGAKSVWLTKGELCEYASVAFGCDVLDRWLATRYDVVARAEFDGTSVLRLRRR